MGIVAILSVAVRTDCVRGAHCCIEDDGHAIFWIPDYVLLHQFLDGLEGELHVALFSFVPL